MAFESCVLFISYLAKLLKKEGRLFKACLTNEFFIMVNLVRFKLGLDVNHVIFQK